MFHKACKRMLKQASGGVLHRFYKGSTGGVYYKCVYIYIYAFIYLFVYLFVYINI